MMHCARPPVNVAGSMSSAAKSDAERRKRVEEFIAPFRVKPGSKVVLSKDFDPSFKAGVKKKKEGVALLAEGVRLLCEYQARLAAQDTWGVLVVLQALDAAGKDGTIRHVMSGVNPQGVSVHSFKVPTAEELDHDYLWRYSRALPARGDIGIFNRSHYEEVLVVRVHPENLERQRLPKEARGQGVEQRIEDLGNRPAGRIDPGHALVVAATDALRGIGIAGSHSSASHSASRSRCR